MNNETISVLDYITIRLIRCYNEAHYHYHFACTEKDKLQEEYFTGKKNACMDVLWSLYELDLINFEIDEYGCLRRIDK